MPEAPPPVGIVIRKVDGSVELHGDVTGWSPDHKGVKIVGSIDRKVDGTIRRSGAALDPSVYNETVIADSAKLPPYSVYLSMKEQKKAFDRQNVPLEERKYVAEPLPREISYHKPYPAHMAAEVRAAAEASWAALEMGWGNGPSADANLPDPAAVPDDFAMETQRRAAELAAERADAAAHYYQHTHHHHQYRTSGADDGAPYDDGDDTDPPLHSHPTGPHVHRAAAPRARTSGSPTLRSRAGSEGQETVMSAMGGILAGGVGGAGAPTSASAAMGNAPHGSVLASFAKYYQQYRGGAHGDARAVLGSILGPTVIGARGFVESDVDPADAAAAAGGPAGWGARGALSRPGGDRGGVHHGAFGSDGDGDDIAPDDAVDERAARAAALPHTFERPTSAVGGGTNAAVAAALRGHRDGAMYGAGIGAALTGAQRVDEWDLASGIMESSVGGHVIDADAMANADDLADRLGHALTSPHPPSSSNGPLVVTHSASYASAHARGVAPPTYSHSIALPYTHPPAAAEGGTRGEEGRGLFSGAGAASADRLYPRAATVPPPPSAAATVAAAGSVPPALDRADTAATGTEGAAYYQHGQGGYGHGHDMYPYSGGSGTGDGGGGSPGYMSAGGGGGDGGTYGTYGGRAPYHGGYGGGSYNGGTPSLEATSPTASPYSPPPGFGSARSAGERESGRHTGVMRASGGSGLIPRGSGRESGSVPAHYHPTPPLSQRPFPPSAPAPPSPGGSSGHQTNPFPSPLGQGSRGTTARAGRQSALLAGAAPNGRHVAPAPSGSGWTSSQSLGGGAPPVVLVPPSTGVTGIMSNRPPISIAQMD